MLIAISAALVWYKALPPGNAQVAAIYMKEVSITGYDLMLGPFRVGLLIVISAAIPALLLTVEPKPKTKPLLLGVHITCSAIVLVLAIKFLGPQLGVLLALVGSLLLLAGGITRYR